MKDDGLSPGEERARTELARKLNLLVDVITAPNGKPVTYRLISEHLASRGIRLSRARWIYMLSGTRWTVTDRALLTGIAGYFEIDPRYLTETDGDVPSRVEAALQYVRAERLGAVRLYAARKLGDVSPETLERLTAILDEASASALTDRDREETE